MIRKLINITSRTIDYIVLIALLIILAYGIYSIYSSYAIINNAKLDDEILHLKPTGSTDNSNNISKLKEFNQNIFAWIELDGTKIDYPMVQGEDNHEYLRKDYKGNFSVSGAIYLDYKNRKDFTDPYSIVYGHHMGRSAMFGDLDKYKDKDFFNNNTTGRIYLENKTYNLYIFGIIIVPSKDATIFNIDFLHPISNIDRLTYIKEKSLFYRDIGANNESKIVALSTCNGSPTNTDRIVVFAVLEESL